MLSNEFQNQIRDGSQMGQLEDSDFPRINGSQSSHPLYVESHAQFGDTESIEDENIEERSSDIRNWDIK